MQACFRFLSNFCLLVEEAPSLLTEWMGPILLVDFNNGQVPFPHVLCYLATLAFFALTFFVPLFKAISYHQETRFEPLIPMLCDMPINNPLYFLLCDSLIMHLMSHWYFALSTWNEVVFFMSHGRDLRRGPHFEVFFVSRIRAVRRYFC